MNLGAIARLLIPGPRRQVAVLASFADDSETYSKTITVALCIAPAPQWARFRRDWQKALDRKGLDRFHMRDFVGRRGSKYQGWDDYEAYFLRLRDILGRYTSIRAGVCIDLPQYKARMAAYRSRKPLSPMSAYTLAMLEAMKLANLLLTQRDISEPLVWAADAGATQFPEATSWVAGMYQKEDLRDFYRLGSGLTPANTLDNPEVQAADIIAYCLREFLEGPSPDAKPYLDLLTKSRATNVQYWHYVEPALFDDMERLLDIGVDALRERKQREKWLRRRIRKMQG